MNSEEYEYALDMVKARSFDEISLKNDEINELRATNVRLGNLATERLSEIEALEGRVGRLEADIESEIRAHRSVLDQLKSVAGERNEAIEEFRGACAELRDVRKLLRSTEDDLATARKSIAELTERGIRQAKTIGAARRALAIEDGWSRGDE